MPLSVAIADSQYLIRLGLSCLLQDSGEVEVVGDAADWEELRELLRNTQPQVIILDYNNPKAFQKSNISEINRLAPHTGVMVISADSERASICGILEQGVNCFLTKSCGEEEIMKGIAATARGEKFFCGKVLDVLLQKSFETEPENCEAIPLTPRETEIVKLVAEGKTAKEIAEEINISIHTIYTHRKNIMKKLDVHSASELVRFALENKIV